MPPFPEKEVGGLLNLLKKKRPGRVPEVSDKSGGGGGGGDDSTSAPKNSVTLDHHNSSGNNGTSGSTDLLGLGLGDAMAPAATVAAASTNGVNGFDSPTNNIAK